MSSKVVLIAYLLPVGGASGEGNRLPKCFPGSLGVQFNWSSLRESTVCACPISGASVKSLGLFDNAYAYQNLRCAITPSGLSAGLFEKKLSRR